MKSNAMGNIAQIIVLAIVVAGFVVLTVMDKSTSDYIGLVTPLLAAVFVVQHVNFRSDQQDQKLKEIEQKADGR